MGVKIYLDDRLAIPNGFIGVRTVKEFKIVVMRNKDNIDLISFDHDLAIFDKKGNEITGYTAICWLEKMLSNGKIKSPPIAMRVHSSNGSVINKMNLAIKSIYRYFG